jgi:hypothetical protein
LKTRLGIDQNLRFAWNIEAIEEIIKKSRLSFLFPIGDSIFKTSGHLIHHFGGVVIDGLGLVDRAREKGRLNEKK